MKYSRKTFLQIEERPLRGGALVDPRRESVVVLRSVFGVARGELGFRHRESHETLVTIKHVIDGSDRRITLTAMLMKHDCGRVTSIAAELTESPNPEAALHFRVLDSVEQGLCDTSVTTATTPHLAQHFQIRTGDFLKGRALEGNLRVSREVGVRDTVVHPAVPPVRFRGGDKLINNTVARMVHGDLQKAPNR